jgi:RecQ family ATP-dependent DNA helicase
MNDALLALRKFFGFEDFRKGQREVIEAILEGHDTVVVMPTGGGKSLCYQLPALIRDGLTLVVSPLIALMKDQVDALVGRGLPATFINSSIDFDEQKERVAGVRAGRYKLVYVAPERFRSSYFLEVLQRARISLFAVDEAHCISSWGHDFRPDYLRLKTFLEQCGHPQTLALTATATPHVRGDIIEQLKLRDPRAFVSGFDRPNLSLNVIHTERERDKIARVRSLARDYAGGAGIIYASTRKAVEQVAERLRDARLNAVPYHAGMADDARARAQNDFMSGRVQMIVATNAFGMGIDKPDIRFVAHYQMPGSIEAYYQEIGRAGRDGQPSSCMLLFNYADKRTQDYFIEGSYPPPEIIGKVYDALCSTGLKRIELSTSEIAARASVRNEMAVQSALITLEKAKHIERGAAAENRATVRLLMPSHLAREALDARKSAQMKQVLFALIGGYNLDQRTARDLDVGELASILTTEVQSVRRTLASLRDAGIIDFRPARRTRGVVMLDEQAVTRLRIRPEEVARRAALEQRKLREMISYCYAETCFRAFILDYFGDRAHPKRCGACGNCQPSSSGATSRRASEQKPVTGREKKRVAPLEQKSELDRFVMRHVPIGSELDDELKLQSRLRREREAAEARHMAEGESRSSTFIHSGAREPTVEEALRIRKILACAARMGGRFGKTILAATLRGSRSTKVTQAGLDKLSTYGLLSGMTQDAIAEYIDALVSAGCLKLTAGAYPTVSLTPFGSDVMRERASVKVSLTEQ